MNSSSTTHIVFRKANRILVALLWLLGAVTIALWARSHLVGESWRWVSLDDRPDELHLQRWAIHSGSGGLGYFWDSLRTQDPQRIQRMRWRMSERMEMFPPGYTHVTEPSYPPRVGGTDFLLSPIGVHLYTDERSGRGGEYQVFALTLPLWLILVVTIAYPVARYVMHVLAQERDERLSLGMCPRCDCDMRGLERCPSCGKQVPSEAPVVPV